MDFTYILLALALFAIPYSDASPPKIDKEKTTNQRQLDYTPHVAKGSAFEFQCVATGSEPMTYTWTKDGKPIEDGKDGRIKVEGGKVKIDKLDPAKDDGNYQCTVKNAEGMDVTSSLALKVAVAGSFVETCDSFKEVTINVTLGKRLQIPCPAHSYFYPKGFDWGFKRVGPASSLTMDRRRTILKSGAVYFSYVIQDDIDEINANGGLRCIIHSGGQEFVSCAMKLRKVGVVTEYSGPEMIQKLENVVALKDSRLVLTCIATGRPTPTMTWYKDGQEVRDKPYILLEGKTRLNIKALSKENEGKYKCTASSTYDNKTRTDSSEAFVKVEVKPQWKSEVRDIAITEGELLKVFCSASGDPMPTYKWYKTGKELGNGNRFQINKDVLTVQSVSMEESGTYQCSASNKHGTIVSTFTITVTKPTTPPPTTTTPSTPKPPVEPKSSPEPPTTVPRVSSPQPSQEKKGPQSGGQTVTDGDGNGSDTMKLSAVLLAATFLHCFLIFSTLVN